MIVALVWLACAGPAAPEPTGEPVGEAPVAEAPIAEAAAERAPPGRPPVDDGCGARMDDWCPAPAGDPCGAHADTEACRADPRCEGRVYRGESFVPCRLDERCFASNCATVGCLSRCETLDAAACAAHAPRCAWDGAACARSEACVR